MRKANLHMSPLERAYISTYGETAEVTMMKLREQGLSPYETGDIIQERMDAMWKKLKEEHEKQRLEELDFEDCPFLT